MVILWIGRISDNSVAANLNIPLIEDPIAILLYQDPHDMLTAQFPGQNIHSNISWMKPSVFGKHC